MVSQMHMLEGLNLAFIGDFRQLDPVLKQPLYKDTDQVFQNYANCYLELVGQHRFKNDPYFWQNSGMVQYQNMIASA